MRATYVWFVLALSLLCADTFAQTMYRCGKSYQDKPCDTGQKGKVVGSTGTTAATAAAAASTTGVPLICVQRANDSQKVVWSREGGATLQRLLDNIDDSRDPPGKKAEDKIFVRDVYRRPGTAGQVQAAVQADCVAQKEKEERAAALAAAAAKAQRELNPGSGNLPTQGQAAADPNAAAHAQKEVAMTAAEQRKSTCSRLRATLDSIGNQERAGGSAGTMDRLRQQRSRVGDELRSAGC